MISADQEIEQSVVNFAELADWWKSLRTIMAPDDPIRDAAEWKRLDDYFDPPKAELDGPAVFIPAGPKTWPNDPAGTRKATIVAKTVNKRLWRAMLESASGKGELVGLWAKPGTLLKDGWSVWVKPKEGGNLLDWELVGAYNKYGERLE